MKIFKFYFIFFCLIIANGFSFGYEYEGFLEYNEGEEGISFECEDMCLIKLGERNNADFLYIDGLIGGSGKYIIWTEDLVGRLYFDGGNLSGSEDQTITFSKVEKELYKIPRERKVLFEFFGTITGNIKVDLITLSFVQKIGRGWKDFWKIETLRNTDMNQRKGIVVRGKSIMKYGYEIFIVLSVCILIFVRKKWKQKFKIIFYVGISLFLLLGIRNTVTFTSILNEGMFGFYSKTNFIDHGDFLSFMDEVRNTLGIIFEDDKRLDCKIYMESYENRNINHHGRFYFKPCSPVYDKDSADYLIYHKVGIPDEDLNKEVLVEFNGSYLLDNKAF